MITINQYINLLETFFINHPQINTVLIGDEYDFSSVSDIIYPVVNIEYLTQNIQDTKISHQFEITIGDLYSSELKQGRRMIYSDCNMIAQDCIDFFDNQYNEDYEIITNINIQKFSDDNVDRIAGCVFVITFNQFREANACIIPSNVISEFDIEFAPEFR